MTHVFISYSHSDKEYATKLADSMAKRGLPVWIDNRIDYGERWVEVIQEQLDNCSVFVVIMTSQAFKSAWVQNEVLRALDKKKKIIPLLLEGGVWISLQAIQYVDVTNNLLPAEKFYETLDEIFEIPSEKTALADGYVIEWDKFTQQKDDLILEAQELIKKQFSLFSEMVTPPLANQILDVCIKPSLYNWRSGEIKTIREIQPDVNNRLENWIKRGELNNLIEPIFGIWIKAVSFEIDNIAASFYQEYQVKTKFRFSLYSSDLGLLEEGISLESEQFKAIFSTGLRKALLITYGVIVVVIAQWVETFFQAVMSGSWIGILAYAAFMGLGEYFKSLAGTDKNDFEKGALMGLNVPVFIRKLVLTESKIQSQLNDTRVSLREEINKVMSNELQSKFLDAVCENTKQQMEKQFSDIEESLKIKKPPKINELSKIKENKLIMLFRRLFGFLND